MLHLQRILWFGTKHCLSDSLSPVTQDSLLVRTAPFILLPLSTRHSRYERWNCLWSLKLPFLELLVVALLCEHVLLSIPEQTQESIQRFEQQAGLREAGYTPHKGLTTEETKYHRVAEAVHVRLLFLVFVFFCCCWLCTSPIPVWHNFGSMLLGLLKLLTLKVFSVLCKKITHVC